MTHVGRHRSVAALAVLILGTAAFSVSGLGTFEPQPRSEGLSAPTAGEPSNAGGGAKPVFVMVPKGVHPYFEPVYRGFQAAAKKYGIEVEIDAPPRFDVNLQVKVVEDLIARGVSGIAISADDDTGLVKVVHEAMQAGIKVITFDAPAPSTEALTYIGTDNEQAGYDAGLRMARAMHYRGKLAVLQGGLQATNLNLRAEGFKKALLRVAPEIQVVALVDEQGDFSESIIKTEELLAEFPDLAGIFSVSAEGAPSAATVVRELHRGGKLVIAGFDDLQDTLDGIASGLISFCVVQNTYRMGWLSVEELLAAERGEPIPKVIDTGIVIVDKSNLRTYKSQLAGESD